MVNMNYKGNVERDAKVIVDEFTSILLNIISEEEYTREIGIKTKDTVFSKILMSMSCKNGRVKVSTRVKIDADAIGDVSSIKFLTSNNEPAVDNIVRKAKYEGSLTKEISDSIDARVEDLKLSELYRVVNLMITGGLEFIKSENKHILDSKLDESPLVNPTKYIDGTGYVDLKPITYPKGMRDCSHAKAFYRAILKSEECGVATIFNPSTGAITVKADRREDRVRWTNLIELKIKRKALNYDKAVFTIDIKYKGSECLDRHMVDEEHLNNIENSQTTKIELSSNLQREDYLVLLDVIDKGMHAVCGHSFSSTNYYTWRYMK